MLARRPVLWLALGLVLLLALLLLGLRSYVTSYSFILNTLRHYDSTDPTQLVLVQLRLPRLLLALLAGASLVVSGYLLQTLVTNPLADPYLLGTASGASLGTIASYVLVPSLTVAGVYLPPVAALIGAFAATVLVVALGTRGTVFCPRHCCWQAWRWGPWRQHWAACSLFWLRLRAVCAV